MQIQLFVYGSLKRGFRHEEQLYGALFLGEVSTSPGFGLVRYVEDYPALFRWSEDEPEARTRCVRGELYSVSASRLLELDRFEECPDLYRRDSITLEDGRTAFAYVIEASTASAWPVIAAGEWFE